MSRHLTDDEAFQASGHLSDLALTALADGQDDVMSPKALEHASSCDGCAERLGELALVAVSVADALALPGVLPRAEPARAPRPMPVAAMAAAFVLAILGAVPSLLHAPAWLAELPATVLKSAPITLRAASTLLRAASAEATLVTATWLAAATVLVAIGLVIARMAPREAHQHGGRR